MGVVGFDARDDVGNGKCLCLRTGNGGGAEQDCGAESLRVILIIGGFNFGGGGADLRLHLKHREIVGA